MNRIAIAVLGFFISISTFAQLSFLDIQKTNARFALVLKQKEDTLQKQFVAAGLQWPPKEIYLRSFKYDSQLEVWVRNNDNEQFKLFKSYRICALAGSFGPKRMEGDYQVPEGFYYINKFDPRSEYHFALGINYPNISDKICSDSMNQNPGSGILIHGSCVTVGCIPIMDEPIEEVYILAANAKSNGEDFIPVHIFPVRYNNTKSMDIFNKTVKDNDGIKHFAAQIKQVYDYFEEHKKLPLISIDKKGNYIIM
jgi:murein L,D-transpeptidase YafK